MRGQAAEVAKTEAEVEQKQADSQLKLAKTQEVLNAPQDDGGAGQAKMAEVEVKAGVAAHTADLKERETAQKMSLAEREHQLNREKLEVEIQMKERDMAQKRMDARAKAAQDAATAAAKPPTEGQVANRSRLPTSKS